VQAGQHVAIGVFEGSVEAQVPGKPKPDLIGAKTLWGWQPAEKRAASAPLSPQDQKRLAAWARLGKKPQGVGQLTVKDAQSDSPVRLSVAQYRAHVVLHPPVALVQIDQSFYNPTAQQTEGTFVFNLPRGASVSRFAMYVDPRNLIEGELIERGRAGGIYDSIVHRRRDPAILEQIDENLFKMRVFPIFAHDFKRILLDFTLPLESDDGQFHFDLPLFTDRDPIWDFQVTGAIRGPTRLESVVSFSHPKLKFQQRGPSEITFEWREANFRPTEDLSLNFVQPKGDGPGLRSYTAGPLPFERRQDRAWDPLAGRPATYFLATLPPEAIAPPVAPQPADVVVLVDTSANVKNQRVARQTARMILQNLPSSCRLRVAAADVSCRWLTDGWVAPEGPETRQVIQRLDKVVFLGRLDAKAVANEVLKVFPAEESTRRRVVIFVGAGRAAGTPEAQSPPLAKPAEPLLFAEITDRFRKAKLSGYAALVDAEAADISSLASHMTLHEGAVFSVSKRDDRKGLLEWLLAGLPSSRYVDLEIDGATQDDLFYSGVCLPGRGLTVMGRTAAARQVRLRLNVEQDGKLTERRFELKVQPEQDDVFLGRLWAQRKLERLLPAWAFWPERDQAAWQIPQNNADDPRRQQILAIAQEWSLLTPFTAFLVLESEADYQRWGVDRNLRRRYWKPAEAVAEQPPTDDVYASLRAKLAEAATARQEAADKKRLEEALHSAREVMKAGNHRLAHSVLAGVGKLPLAEKSAEYRALKAETAALVRRDDLLEALGPHRYLLMPTARLEPDRFQASIAPLLASPSSGDFDRRRPHAARLLKEIRVDPEVMTLERLASLLSKETGLNVVPDMKALAEVGIPFDPERAERDPAGPAERRPKKRAAAEEPDSFAELVKESRRSRSNAESPGMMPRSSAARSKRTSRPQFRPNDGAMPETVGWGRMSLRSYAKFVLAQQGLVLVEEPHRLFITTPDEAANKLKTEIYPVADLFLADEAIDTASLANPYLDRESAARDRLRKKLQRPISVKYKDRAFEDVLQDIARALDDNVLIDTKALEEVGFALDKQISASWRDVPIKESLRWILDREGLTYAIDHEAVVITTPDEAGNRLSVRLHSGRGVMMQPSPREMERLQTQLDTDMFAGGMGMGGMMGGFGFGAMGGGFGGRRGGGGMGGMGMAGMGGGMFGGSFGAGMGGGGLGGGMAGMGGMMGGGMGGARATARAADAERLSSGGDAQSPPELDPEMAGDEDDRTEDAIEMHPSPAVSQGGGTIRPRSMQLREGGAWLDIDSVIGMVTSSIQPTTWDEVGGPGSIAFFEPTLDFVFAQTEEVHEQVEALFDDLRKTRVAGGPGNLWVPAEASRGPVEGSGAIDFDSLISLMTSTVLPTTWDSVGGPGSIAPDEPRGALVVSQTQDVHDEFSGLLTLLRRNRYEILRGSRPWEVFESGVGPWMGRWTPAPRWIGASLARLPEPQPEELKDLAVRREPPTGHQAWRRKLPGGAELNAVALSQDGGRLAVRLSGREISVAGNEAAIAYPDLLIAEQGPWGEAVREWLDGVLPWMPHRTNAELARLFDVQPVPENAAKDDAKSDRLRFTLRGSADPNRTYFEIAFSREHGLPVVWESHIDGRLTQRLRFERATGAGSQRLQRVVLEDPTGKMLLVWEGLPSVAPPPPLPDPAKDRAGYIHLDRRFAEPQLDAAFSRALAGLRKRDWRTAAEEFKATLQVHPRHPLVLALLASCRERQPNVASREEFVGWLREAASSPAAGAARFIAQSSFPSLRPDEVYEILGRQPVASRSGADLEQLARAALAANRLQDALGHAEAALKKSQDTPDALRQERLRIEILLRLGQRDKAGREAQSVVSRPETPPAETAELAILLARHGMNQVADSFFKKALTDKDLAGPARGALLLRRAEVQTGLARWRSLLAAAQLAPRTTPEWSRHFEQLLGELSAPADAQAAAILAAETKAAGLRSRLLMRQAELAIDANLAADLAWQVHQMQKLPADQIAWACGLWNAARQSGRTIEVLENRLRRSKTLDKEELKELATAYRHANRPIDAQRADTTPPPTPPQQPGQAQPMPGGFGMGGMGGQGMF
jgi:hypothetical protein